MWQRPLGLEQVHQISIVEEAIAGVAPDARAGDGNAQVDFVQCR